MHGRNHVLEVGVPISWSGVLLPFSRKKNLERYPQFDAVRYQHQTPIKKLRKSWGVRRNFFLFFWGEGPCAMFF